MNPMVSIIIPFYNTPQKLFERCMQSLKDQTFADFEAIIIDDGSSSDCQEYLNSEIATDNRFRVIHKKNEGSAIARNVGISESKGEYIMFLDSDDALTPYCLEEGVNVVHDSHPDLVIGGAKRFTSEEMDMENPERVSQARTIQVNTEENRASLMAHMIGSTDESFFLQHGYIGDGPWARLLKKTIADSTYFSNENMWSDDTIWNIKMLGKCESIIVMDDLWYKYLIFPYSKIRRFRPNCPYEFQYRTKQEIDLFKKLWPGCMNGIYTRVFNDIMLLCRTYLFHKDNNKSFKDKYLAYRNSIHTDAYREALREVSFSRETRLFNRTVKELLRFTTYHGPHFISYFILVLYYHLRKNTF